MRNGLIELYAEPVKSGSYAIAADVATGHGRDNSAAYVIDLATMELCAELQGRIDEDQLAYQLHYLGRMFNTARLAVENGNGWGEAVLIPLRDGREGRPPYPNLYRHVYPNRPDHRESKVYGFPTGEHTRPLILSQLGRALREHALPWLTIGLLSELQTFVHRPKGISPAAMDGCNDDRVMAASITLELYRQFGSWPDQHRPRRKKLSEREKARTWRPLAKP
jgi:hypothetical protein